MKFTITNQTEDQDQKWKYSPGCFNFIVESINDEERTTEDDEWEDDEWEDDEWEDVWMSDE